MLPKPHRLPAFEIQPLLRSGRRIAGDSVQLIYQIRTSSLSVIPAKAGIQAKNDGSLIPETLPRVNKFGMTSKKDSGNLSDIRFAVVVSIKVDKRATRRNRIKRLIHESLSHLLPTMTKPIDGVFVVRKNISEKSQKDVEHLIQDMFSHLGIVR